MCTSALNQYVSSTQKGKKKLNNYKDARVPPYQHNTTRGGGGGSTWEPREAEQEEVRLSEDTEQEPRLPQEENGAPTPEQDGGQQFSIGIRRRPPPVCCASLWREWRMGASIYG
jgi:hypothetical protein